jgi:hypothetical protein
VRWRADKYDSRAQELLLFNLNNAKVPFDSDKDSDMTLSIISRLIDQNNLIEAEKLSRAFLLFRTTNCVDHDDDQSTIEPRTKLAEVLLHQGQLEEVKAVKYSTDIEEASGIIEERMVFRQTLESSKIVGDTSGDAKINDLMRAAHKVVEEKKREVEDLKMRMKRALQNATYKYEKARTLANQNMKGSENEGSFWNKSWKDNEKIWSLSDERLRSGPNTVGELEDNNALDLGVLSSNSGVQLRKVPQNWRARSSSGTLQLSAENLQQLPRRKPIQSTSKFPKPIAVSQKYKNPSMAENLETTAQGLALRAQEDVKYTLKRCIL